MRKIKLTFILMMFCLTVKAKVVFPYDKGGSLDPEKYTKQGDLLETAPLKLYELAQDHVKPDYNEFYLSTIFGNSKNPRALIKRSNNIRAGNLFSEAVEYKIGDPLNETFKIVDIDFKKREVIVKDIHTKEYFSLKLSYGDATSRLIKNFDYKPKKKKRKNRRKNSPRQKNKMRNEQA